MAGQVRYLLFREGRYYARLVIPRDLRPFLDGKSELRTPLGADRRTALSKLPGAAAAIQHTIGLAERRSAAAKGVRVEIGRYPLSPPEIAHRDYHLQLAFDAELRAADHRYAQFGVDYDEARRFRDGFSGLLSDDQLEELVGLRVEKFRAMGHHNAAKGSPEWRTLAQALCVSSYEALAREDERNEGDFTGTPSHPLIANLQTPTDDPVPVSLTGLLKDYLHERGRDGKGREAGRRWSPVFADLRKFLGHNDARRLTKDNVREWKDAKLETLATKTVADVYLASLRTVLNWAVSNDRLEQNVADKVRLPVSKKKMNREQGFTTDEATAILKAARAYQPRQSDDMPAREAKQTVAAKRWSAILQAFTGARIAEITQLRKEDFRYEGGIPVMRITPDAGTVKTGQYRDVPLHGQLVALGFMQFVEQAEAGPLFYRSAKRKDTAIAARMVAGRVSQWLQGEGLIPASVSPTHGWRHRFKTVGRELGISDRTLDAIQGHAPKTAGDSYGDVTIVAKKAAIDKLPPYSLDEVRS